MLLEQYDGAEFIIRLEHDQTAHERSLPSYLLTAQHKPTLQLFDNRSDDSVELYKRYQEWARIAGKPVDK